MKFPEIFPPNDLLKQVEGIESGLRQRQRLGLFGVAAAVAQIFVLIANHEWFLNLLQRNWTELFTAHWRALSILAGVIVCLVLATWARFWIQESQEPFRYTCSIADFVPILPEKADGPKEDRLSVQLSHDLTERLNERIKRLYLLDEKELKAEPAAKDDKQAGQPDVKRKSHVHVRGYYVIRKKPDGAWFIEVMPRVRIGPAGSPEKLAHPVKFKLLRDDSDEQATLKDGTPASAAVVEDMPPKLTARQYEQILERVYFSIATEIYKQIQEDVKRKIELLPTDYFRAVALFHEAEDYANSNTLDAYADATDLYDQALSYFDPDWKPLSTFTPWRIAQRVYRWLLNRWLAIRSRLTVVWPHLGRVEIMRARAEMGYANMLVYRRVLARLSGQRANSSFEAPRVAERSVKRVKALSPDLPECLPRLFEAYVTLALAQYYVFAVRAAERNLAEARALDPVRAENDSRYLFVAGEVESRTRSKVNIYSRAVELDPHFEVAQFSKAYQIEMLWRTRPSLERSTAEAVLREYEEVVKVNPGNVGAWANNGYVRWLLASTPFDFRKSRQAFEDGREYKEIKHETYVAELDYGLARIAAEQGDFDRAYNYYISGLSATLVQGMNFEGLSSQSYFFNFINDQLLKRFEKYKDEVEGNFKLWGRLIDGKWEGRRFSDVITDLNNPLKSAAASKGIAVMLSAISTRLTNADKDQLKESIRDADLTLLIKQLKTSVTPALLAKIASPGLATIVERYIPTLRVRSSIYAFVLTEYGEACNQYYIRNGSEFHRQEALRAYEESAHLSPQYIGPLYRLYEMAPENSPTRQTRLEEIVDIYPDWPDAILALAEVRAKLARACSIEATAAQLEAAAKLAEAEAAEADKRKAEARTAAPSADGINMPQNQLIDDPRLVRSIHAGASAALPDVKIGKDLQKEIDTKKQEAREFQRKAAEKQKEKRILAKQAVDGVRQLLPFSWAEGPLNEELEQAANNGQSHKINSLSRFLRGRNDSVGKQIAALLANKNIRWERDLDDIHVRALLTWATIRPFLAGSSEVAHFNGRIVLRGEELLCHIRHHFWPDDFNLHKTLRDLSKPIAAWESLPGPDERKLKEFFATSYGAKWLRRASLSKTKSAEEVALANRQRGLTVRLDEQKSRATVVISGIKIEVKENERYLDDADNLKKVCWSNVPGSDEMQMRLMLQRRFGAGWLRKASLTKNSDESMIEITHGERKLSLKIEPTDPVKGLVTHEFKVDRTGEQRNICYFEYERASNELMRDAIIRAWEADRGSLGVLGWVTDPSIDSDLRHRILTSVSKEDDLPSSVYKWLGEQWFDESAAGFSELSEALAGQDQPSAASAMRRAKNSIDHGLGVYRKAMEGNRDA